VASSEVLGADLKQLFAAAFDAVPVRDSLVRNEHTSHRAPKP
jgi:hypothetical protein